MNATTTAAIAALEAMDRTSLHAMATVVAYAACAAAKSPAFAFVASTTKISEVVQSTGDTFLATDAAGSRTRSNDDAKISNLAAAARFVVNAKVVAFVASATKAVEAVQAAFAASSSSDRFGMVTWNEMKGFNTELRAYWHDCHTGSVTNAKALAFVASIVKATETVQAASEHFAASARAFEAAAEAVGDFNATSDVYFFGTDTSFRVDSFAFVAAAMKAARKAKAAADTFGASARAFEAAGEAAQLASDSLSSASVAG